MANEINRYLVKRNARHHLMQRVAAGASEPSEPLTFDREFVEDMQVQASYWRQRVIGATKMSVLVASGVFSFTSMYGFPDLDISTLGIGKHRFFLFHSGVSIWVLRKIYEAYLARTFNASRSTDRVVNKILGVMAAGAAFGVGCHLLVDVAQPKSIVFPFFGSLINGTLVDDNLWLLGNSIWCFKMGTDMFALALGDEMQAVKGYINEKIYQPIKEGVLARRH